MKTFLVLAVSSLTFFGFGFGFSQGAEGGLYGTKKFFGSSYLRGDYTNFIFYFSLCVKMAVIASGSIVMRTR